MEVRIICDNGGGITLQLTNEHTRATYQHHYHSPQEAARDLLVALTDQTFADWDQNALDEGDDWLKPSDEQLHNGSYQVYEYLDELLADVDSSWRNVRELRAAVCGRIRTED